MMLADQDRSFIAKEGDLKTKLMLSVFFFPIGPRLSLIHISEPTRQLMSSRMPSSA